MDSPSSPSRHGGEWTVAELELLERHFHSMTSKALWQHHFPERTYAAVKGMARKLGLKKYHAEREYGQTAWTEKERRLVAEHFPALKAPEIQRRFLPHRSVIAIRAAAKKLGLRAFETHAWTEEELAKLRRHYPEGGPERVHQHLPARTLEAIRARAKAEGIRHVRRGDGTAGDDWSDDELERLWQHRRLPANELARMFPHRSRRAVITKRHKLEYSPVRKWSSRELDMLREHLDASLDALCSMFPDRPRQGINLKRKRLRRQLAGDAGSINPHDRLHLNALNRWTKDEIDRLHKHLDAPLAELCLLFPTRPRDGVRRKRARLRSQLTGR